MREHKGIRGLVIGLALAAGLAIGLVFINHASADWAVSPGTPGGLNVGMKWYIDTNVADEAGVNAALPADTHIVGVFQIATTATGNCDFYDLATIAGVGVVALREAAFAELAEDTQWDSNYLFFPYPIKLKNGLSIGNEDSTCGVYYL